MKLKRQIYLVILLWVKIGYSQEAGSGYNLDFSGNSSRVVFDNIYQNLELPFSMSAWIQLPANAPTNRQPFFASCWPDNKVYSGFWVAIGSNSLGVAYGDGRGALNPAFRNSKSGGFSGDIGGIWAHATFVVEGSRNMRLYLNGVEVDGSYSGSGNEEMVGVSDGQAQIGFLSNNNGDQFFNGRVDDLRLYNFALSQSQIRSHLVKKIENTESGLIGYWKFDEGTGGNLEELISNQIGTIEGDVSWEVSGAPLGDESFFEYFEAGTKKRLFRNENDSFWISTESENWVGYHVYKVNEEPNSVTQSTVDMSKGYYGIFPIFEGGRSDEYRVDFGNAQCTAGNFRNGNSDTTWEIAMQSDSSNYFNLTNIVEFAFEEEGSIKPIGSVFLICDDESLVIDATSIYATSYNWFNTSSNSEIEITEPGNYWLERTSTCGIFRENFSVSLTEINSDFLEEDFYALCKSDLPFPLIANSSRNFNWNTGEVDSVILVSTGGVYWAEYNSECGIVRDSVLIEIAELSDVFIPNVLTPNGDSINECFVIDNELSDSELLVFNRAGVEIFRSNEYQNNWCPDDIPSGVYFYQIKNTCYQESFKGYISVLK